jgi:hypothetical protein
MPRRLLNIASIVCLVLCVALMGMWVRSYSWLDDITLIPLGAYSVGVGSAMGRIAIGAEPKANFFQFRHTPVADFGNLLAIIDQRFSNIAGFGIANDVSKFSIMVPYWFAILVVGILGYLPRSRVKYRFGLRTLFIATTFLAIVLGMIAWLDRAWIGK